MLRLFFYGVGRHIPMMIDTGFTMEVLMDRKAAETAQLVSTDTIRSGVLASGRLQLFKVYQGEVEWFGQRKQVEVDVPIHEENDARNESYILGAAEAAPVIGTKLLSFTRLEINFVDQTLTVKKLM